MPCTSCGKLSSIENGWTSKKDNLTTLVTELTTSITNYESYCASCDCLTQRLGKMDFTANYICPTGRPFDGGALKKGQSDVSTLSKEIGDYLKELKEQKKTAEEEIDSLKTKLDNYHYICGSCWAATHPNSGGCFLADTNVLTNKGFRTIKSLRKGSIVVSYNEETQKNECCKVIKKFVHKLCTDDLYELLINNKTLKVTSEHRFYVIKDKKSEWIEAKKLSVNDLLLNSEGKKVKIDNITYYSNKSTVYNLEVEKYHNYYVGEGYLVHNRKTIH